jgi:sec-independent protein translocase protein TatA
MNLASVMLGWIGPWQIVLIVVVILLLFGGRKIPELMRGLGGGIKEFKSAVKEDEDPSTKDSSEEKKDDSQSKTT